MIGIRQILKQAIDEINTEFILGNTLLGEWAVSSEIQHGRIWERNVVLSAGPIIHLDTGVNETQNDIEIGTGGRSNLKKTYNFTIYLMYQWNKEENILDTPYRMDEIIPILDEEEAVADIINRNLLDKMDTIIRSQPVPIGFQLMKGRGVFDNYLESHQLTNAGWVSLILQGSIKIQMTGC